MKVTVDDIMRLNPCKKYPRERVEELWGDRPYLTPREILELEIPPTARAWALVMLTPPDQQLRWAVEFEMHGPSVFEDILEVPENE